MIEEAVNHTLLEAEMAKQIDKQQEEIKELQRFMRSFYNYSVSPAPNVALAT
jgi:hypothetical protein